MENRSSRCLAKSLLLALSLTVSAAFAQQSDRVRLGSLETGATVLFVRASGGEWGIEISGGTAPRLTQQKPARLEVFRTEKDIRELTAGYKTVQQSDSDIDARAEIAYGKDVVFRVRDLWSLSGAVVSVRRNVEVVGNAPGGFNSSIVFTVDSSVRWFDVNCLAPGALYGDPTHDGDRSPGGTLNYKVRTIPHARGYSPGSAVCTLVQQWLLGDHAGPFTER